MLISQPMGGGSTGSSGSMGMLEAASNSPRTTVETRRPSVMRTGPTRRDPGSLRRRWDPASGLDPRPELGLFAGWTLAETSSGRGTGTIGFKGEIPLREMAGHAYRELDIEQDLSWKGKKRTPGSPQGIVGILGRRVDQGESQPGGTDSHGREK